jgi:ATP-dependent helicase/nuclease subunit B
VDAYLDWCVARSERWAIAASELERTHSVCQPDTRLTLTGRIDRVDRCADGAGVIDYKTGTLPHTDALRAGESCQLLHYAMLLDEPVAEVALLGLQRDAVREHAVSGEALHALLPSARERVLRLKRALDAGAMLPAWGDVETCAYCDLAGVCRKEFWPTAAAPR